MELQTGQKVGDYTVVGQLGEGGMSTVYRARDDKNNRDVVLKFPHSDIMGDIATHERFNREVKIGQLLHHPHIQQLYELVYVGKLTFIVLEYVPGESMRHVLREWHKVNGPDGIKMAQAMGEQIGSALVYAHSHHVAHRDLKPENIIVTPDMQAKVMDFGIALLRGARRVTWGPLSNQVGTPDYMSPEQIQGGRGDARTDIYALGMILYEIITGRLPYHGDNPLAIMNQHVNLRAPAISKYRKDIPPPLEEIIMKAIRLRPQDRWQSMDLMMAALHDWSTVDVAVLREERLNEPEGSSMKKAAANLPIPINSATFITIVLIVLLIGGAILAASFIHPHPR